MRYLSGKTMVIILLLNQNPAQRGKYGVTQNHWLIVPWIDVATRNLWKLRFKPL